MGAGASAAGGSATAPSSPKNGGMTPPMSPTSGAAPLIGKASNGETSKSRKFVAEADCYDDLVAWLDWEFHKNDINKDGYLDYHEFVKFVVSLDLNMSIQDVFQFFILADKDNDYRVMWREVEEDVGLILQKIYKGTAPSKNDWCTMITPAGDTVWYNKRTGDTSKTLPVELDPKYKPPASAEHEAILENTKTFDVALTWLDWEFKKADYDKSGTLSTQEFNNFVRGLKIGLSEKEIAQFARLADSNGDGTVEWVEVLELAPLILRKLYAGIEPGPHDWCMIVDSTQRRYFMNKRTGQTQEEMPVDFNVPADELAISLRRKSSIAELPISVENDLAQLSSRGLSSGNISPVSGRDTASGASPSDNEAGKAEGETADGQPGAASVAA